MIEIGSLVILHLGTPREQVFGVVLSLQPAGLVVRGMTLHSVEDWLRGLDPQGVSQDGLGPSTTFYPMHRVEKAVLDEPFMGVASIGERFEQRTGLRLVEALTRVG